MRRRSAPAAIFKQLESGEPTGKGVVHRSICVGVNQSPDPPPWTVAGRLHLIVFRGPLRPTLLIPRFRDPDAVPAALAMIDQPLKDAFLMGVARPPSRGYVALVWFFPPRIGC